MPHLTPIFHIFLLDGQVREEATGMPDEKHYVGTLLELDEALRRLPQMEAHITQMAYWYWRRTVQTEERLRTEAEAEATAGAEADRL